VAACLLDPEKHNGQTYRFDYQAATCDQIAAIFTEVIGQPFSYESQEWEDRGWHHRDWKLSRRPR
jgi:NAD(P)H dehydrogenase (quinone)